MQTNYKEDCINAFNHKIARAYADFSTALDEIERITPEDEKYLFKEKSAQIDNIYQSIITNMRPHLRKYLELQL